MEETHKIGPPPTAADPTPPDHPSKKSFAVRPVTP
jgi:hypothetical protein